MSDDRLTIYPLEGGLLDWYGGAYDLAYIALHPFFRIPGLDPRTADYGTFIMERSQTDPFLPVFDALQQGRDADRAGKLHADAVEALTKARGIPLTWQDVCDAAGFEGYPDLNRALLSTISSLPPAYHDEAGAARLRVYCTEQRLFMPTEGVFQVLMEPRLATLFAATDAQHVEIASDFDEARTVSIEKLTAPHPWMPERGFPPFPRRIYLRDRSLLAVVHWDSFFTLICGTAERLRGVEMPKLFDGFTCPPGLPHNWWLEKPTAIWSLHH